uniref:TNFR-Cys domain-containing protein n=1 Tax=Magallana gigas TaxID=29159 RepID=K1PUZ0_MAGGI
MACLLTNSSVVRRKVFKPYKTKKLTIVLAILLSFSWANCPTGFIGHKNPDEDVCCKPTSCFPGTFVQHCQLNFTSDVCIPCEANSYQLDFTNSSFPHPCIKANCHPGAMMTSAFSRSGCRLRCKCDEENGYYGEDPCNCKRIAVAITIGLMIMMCFLYLYCELQSRRSTSLNLGQGRPGVYTP